MTDMHLIIRWLTWLHHATEEHIDKFPIFFILRTRLEYCILNLNH